MRAVAVLFAVLLTVAGCSQASEVPERREKESAERAAEDPAVGAAECSDFASPEEAMDYYTSEASEAEKRALDANQDGFACNESAVASAQASSSPAMEVESASADAAKAEAAGEEATLKDLERMSDDEAILLGNCQTVKYQIENGKAAMDRWTEEFVDNVVSAPSAGDVVSVQEAMIKDGYSCTFGEMNQISAYGTLPEE